MPKREPWTLDRAAVLRDGTFGVGLVVSDAEVTVRGQRTVVHDKRSGAFVSDVEIIARDLRVGSRDGHRSERVLVFGNVYVAGLYRVVEKKRSGPGMADVDAAAVRGIGESGVRGPAVRDRDVAGN